jgi:hypothetical protein
LLVLQEEEKLAVASSSKAASRFAYDVLVNDDEVSKAPGVKRGKDGHVQLNASSDDFFSAPLGGGKAASSKCVASLPLRWGTSCLWCFGKLKLRPDWTTVGSAKSRSSDPPYPSG